VLAARRREAGGDERRAARYRPAQSA
jgi:hypothetical protein